METAIRRYLANLIVMQNCSAKRDCPAHEELYDEVTRFNSTLEDFSLVLRFIQNCITLQLNVVHSLVAQRDSGSNLDVAINSASIARASKRDSSAMTAIAVITAFFLPGTFIAVFHFAFIQDQLQSIGVAWLKDKIRPSFLCLSLIGVRIT